MRIKAIVLVIGLCLIAVGCQYCGDTSAGGGGVTVSAPITTAPTNNQPVNSGNTTSTEPIPATVSTS